MKPTSFAVLVLSAGLSFTTTAHAGPYQNLESVDVRIPRIDSSAQVDGVLNEPQWTQAAVLSGFFQFLPVDGRPAEDSTHVLVWYAPTGIYFGIRAFEVHGEVHATLADRDKISADDFVQILLDTFDDQRQAIVVGVNPFGVQADGIARDASRRSSVMARSNNSLPYRADLTPDFVYESWGRLTDYGYEIEVHVPFKSLRYQSEDEQEWGFNVIRRVQHSGYSNAWIQIDLSNASFLSQSGRLTGLSDLRRGLVLDITPVLTASADRTQGIDDGDFSVSNPEPGGNLRWGITNNLTLNATVNPDFSQVEADVTRVSYDPRRAVYFPEKRPFFLDGIEQFQTPQRVIYSRRLSRPVGAVKLTGKVSGVNIGFLTGADRRSTSLTGDDFRFFNALRISQDLWGQSSLGIAYTDKVDGDHTNRVAALDGRFVFANSYSLTFQGSGSYTNEGGASSTDFAPMWIVQGSRSGRRFGLNVSVRGTHKDFNAESGFISQTDIASVSVVPRLTFFGKAGSTLESFTTSTSFIGKWTYDDFVSGKETLDRQFFFTTEFGLRGGWSLGTSLLVETFGYPEELYDDYYIERTDDSGVPVDTVAFSGPSHLNNLSYALNIVTPRFSKFSGNVYAFYGRDENWWEWAGADLIIINGGVTWTPTDQFRVNFLYNHLQYIRPSDRSIVQIRRIPRLKVEYQLSRAIFLRLVGQYDSNAVDALRDNSRTEDPILRPDEEGVLQRVEKVRKNDFRVDWLFSYRPTPGTVFFFGYGTSLIEPNTFRFRDLERLSDGFFLKLSYLFRV